MFKRYHKEGKVVLLDQCDDGWLYKELTVSIIFSKRGRVVVTPVQEDSYIKGLKS